MDIVPITYQFCRSGNVQDSWLGAYWKWLWAMQIPKKVVLFRWLLVHYGIPVKSWMWGHRHDLKCGSCVFILNMFTVSYGYVLFLEQFGKEGWEFSILFMVMSDGEGLLKKYSIMKRSVLIFFFSLMEGRHRISLMLQQSVVW